MKGNFGQNAVKTQRIVEARPQVTNFRVPPRMEVSTLSEKKVQEFKINHDQKV